MTRSTPLCWSATHGTMGTMEYIDDRQLREWAKWGNPNTGYAYEVWQDGKCKGRVYAMTTHKAAERAANIFGEGCQVALFMG